MSDIPRKKSPRAPSISLEEALLRVKKIYDHERLHPAPTEIVAKHLGYKSANNGSALATLASIRYFGLLTRPKEGMLSVSKEVESYEFAPDENQKRSLLLGFLRCPSLYNDLLEKYASGLPSDANLKFELIQRGFTPPAAEAALVPFKRSVFFADYYGDTSDLADEEYNLQKNMISVEVDPQLPMENVNITQNLSKDVHIGAMEDAELDRIPVRLPGGRKSWLLIPTPFFNADKERLKAQIDLLLTIEDENSLN